MEAEYDKILQEINPDIAEKQLQRNEISALKTQMSEMNKNMSELMAANRLLMEQLTKQKKMRMWEIKRDEYRPSKEDMIRI